MTSKDNKSTPHTTPRGKQYRHTTVRLDKKTLERIEALRKLLSTDWHTATMTDILRAMIRVGLDIIEKQGNINSADSSSKED